MMTRWGLARWPGIGRAAWLTVAGLCLASPAAARHRIPYAPLPLDQRVVWHFHKPPPRIAYAALPLDERIAPDDLALDADETDAPGLAEGEAAAERVALVRLGQNYRPHPAIWRIGDQDTTIYLFGTVHVLPPGFQWRSAALDRIVAQAGTLLIESVDDSGGAADPDSARGANTPALAPLAVRVSPDHRAALQRFTTGLPPEAARLMDGLPTWAAAMSVGFVREMRDGNVPGPGADDWIEQRFRQRGRPVVAIEDGKQVMAAVSAIPEAEQRRMLDAALDAKPESAAELRAPLHAWAKGEIGPGSALTVDLAASSGTDALNGPLLIDRNRAWAAALAARLATPGVVLFAAGAGHFVGNDSVLELLRRRGIRVTRVE